MTLEDMDRYLAALLEMRFRGMRSMSYEGKNIQYATDAELASAISDLESRIRRAEGKSDTSRVFRPYATKGY